MVRTGNFTRLTPRQTLKESPRGVKEMERAACN